MSVIGPGTPAPDFTLRTEDGQDFTLDGARGQTTVLVFFPSAFSSVCSDQFNLYQEVLTDLAERGARLYGVSTDSSYSQHAFRESLGVEIPMLSDFEPKGEVARAFGVYYDSAGTATRALVILDPEGVVQWSWEGEHPGVLPGANLIFDGLAA